MPADVAPPTWGSSTLPSLSSRHCCIHETWLIHPGLCLYSTAASTQHGSSMWQVLSPWGSVYTARLHPRRGLDPHLTHSLAASHSRTVSGPHPFLLWRLPPPPG